MSIRIAPDYYPTFQCKRGSCRSTCCRGWGITVSMSEYFRFIGLPCGKSLRERLDGAFHIVARPTPERYAMISPNWKGDCPLRARDGLCTLHRERGEKSLPAICRVYPRRIIGGACALSGSCEAVIETLLAREEPIRWIEVEETRASEPPHAPRNEGMARYDTELRMLSIRVLQDRRLHISERMMRLGRILGALYECVRARDWVRMGEMIADFGAHTDQSPGQAKYGPDVTDATFRVAEAFSKNSESLSSYWEAGVRNLARAGYPEIRRAFEQKYPEWERHFEQITVNHAFFTRFPYTDIHDDLWAEYAALCAAHCVVMYISTIYTYDREGPEPLADAIAAAFRMIEHSDFERRAHLVFARLGLGTQAKLNELLCAL